LRDADDGMHINQMVMETQLAYNIVSSELIMMELQDMVKSMPGGIWRMKK
jgi:predicted Rossmann fold nucleotide-binding protein DprA/Smf involved in DNA uptake